MLRYFSVSILLISLLFTGCSSNKRKDKSIFSEEQKAELKNILDRYLTDQDWDRYQQEIEQLEKLANYDTGIDFKKDFDNPMILEIILTRSIDKPNLQKELTSFMTKYMQGKIIELKSGKNKVLTEEEMEKQFEHPHN